MKLSAVIRPRTPPEQAALGSKAGIGPNSSGCAIAGPHGNRRQSGVNVAQTRQAGRNDGAFVRAWRAERSPMVGVVSPGPEIYRDWTPQRARIHSGSTPNCRANSLFFNTIEGNASA